MIKNFILLSIIACFVFFSCTSSSLEKDIKANIGLPVKELSIKPMHISKCFYKYAEECTSLYDKYADEIDKLDTYTEHEFGDSIDIYADYSVDMDLSAYEEENAYYDSICNTYTKEIDEMLSAYKSAEKKYVDGNLYVVRYFAKDNNGNWENSPTYKIYAYNNDGTIHEYNGIDKFEMILNAYPNARKDMTHN